MRFIFLTLVPFLFYYLCVAYQPFRYIDHKAKLVSSKFIYISKNNLASLIPIEYVDPLSIYLVDTYSSSFVKTFPILNNKLYAVNVPLNITLKDSFFNLSSLHDHNLTFFPPDLIRQCLSRQMFSTFGMTHDTHNPSTKSYKLDYCIYAFADSKLIFSNQLPSTYAKFFEDMLCEPVEFFFYMYNNFIFGNPIITKSSGNETLDSALSDFLEKSASSMGLPDGYYRLSLPP